MASVKITPAVEAVEAQPEVITLTLTREEAQYMRNLYGKQCRGGSMSVFTALDNAGFQRTD
jgi:hypothetical protein